MIRLLVAEDSATARALLVQIFSDDPEIEIVGEARDGVEAVQMTQRLRPDLVTMDIHMPRLDGLSATKEIMITQPTPILIITGSTRLGDVQDSLEILRVGALDVMMKPQGPSSPDFEAASRRLVEAVKSMSRVKVVRHWRPPSTVRHELPPLPTRRDSRARVVAIASSTGGPSALQRVFSGLPAEFPVPIVVVQHITVGFTTGLATWLSTVSPLKVKVAEQGEPLSPRTVYLAPDDRHLGLAGGKVAFSSDPPIGGFRPSGTFLFDSVARAFGSAAVGVILTGMGDDGVAGLRSLRNAEGRVIAQDEKSSIVFGMPGAAIAAGVATTVLPLDDIAAHLLTLI